MRTVDACIHVFDDVLDIYLLFCIRTKQEHNVYTKKERYMKQLAIDITSGMVLGGAMITMTVWMMILSG